MAGAKKTSNDVKARQPAPSRQRAAAPSGTVMGIAGIAEFDDLASNDTRWCLANAERWG